MPLKPTTSAVPSLTMTAVTTLSDFSWSSANAIAARTGLRNAGLNRLRVTTADGGVTTPYGAATPADLALACGVFGNISDNDVRRTVAALPMLSAPRATVFWTRRRRQPD